MTEVVKKGEKEEQLSKSRENTDEGIEDVINPMAPKEVSTSI